MNRILQFKLFLHYRKVIEMIKANPADYIRILLNTNTHFGVCACAKEVFKKDIYSKTWVYNNTNNALEKKSLPRRTPLNGAHWGEPPFHTETSEDCIKALQLRANILRKLVTSFNNSKTIII